MLINHAEITHTAVAPSQFPNTGQPEIVFAGKSNVGKSSLINAVLGRKKLARTSGQPGKTRTINFYQVEKKMYFVDLPGYGYARVSKTEQAKWGKMVEGYLKGRKEIARVFLLLDIRHEPGPNDLMLYDWFLHYGTPITLLCTKSDKLGKNQVAKQTALIKRKMGQDSAIPFSSKTKDGRDEVWGIIMDSLGDFVVNCMPDSNIH